MTISTFLKYLFPFFLLFVSVSTNGQNGIWSKVEQADIPESGTRIITPLEFRTFRLNLSSLDDILTTAPTEQIGQLTTSSVILEIPNANGEMEEFSVYYSPIIEQPLADLFPEIKTFAGYSEGGSYVRLDHTPQGFHAMVIPKEGDVWFVDPYTFGNIDSEYYVVYNRKNHAREIEEFLDCSTVNDSVLDRDDIFGNNARYGDCQHRNYRLALSASAEYTAFHGGSVALAQAAQVTTMNRVNGVFESELAVRMTIIGNNNLIIYTNAGSDPFTNGTPGSMINENQTSTDAVIGAANYDIGHVFGTNSGGLAQLYSPCSGNKARGVTGSGAPIGDSFDIDYVAHEIGHQFGAHHTQNNPCNSTASTSMEPGSAATIMGYAGICAPNVQNNSDDYFHAISLQEMGNFITGAGNSCATVTGLGNSAPTITGSPGNVTVPASTPFALTATSSDPDGDAVLYCWEQMDPTAATMPPVANATDGPNFRSFDPTLSPTRYFPNMAAIVAGTTPMWEVLSNVSRSMPFRISIRDYAPGGGCTDHEDINVTIDGSSGPFVVTYPSASGITFTGNTNETIIWNVAGTAGGAVACANVDIFLSTDGGITYPVQLADNVSNDGSETILVPNTATSTARIMVMCENGTFFDISDNDFTIAAATFDYTLATTSASISVCQPANAVFTVNVGSIGGYSDPVTLSVSGTPAGTTASFGTNPLIPGNSTTLTFTNIASATPGIYSLVLQGNSTSGIKTENLTLTINAGTPSAVTNSIPADGAINVSIPTTLAWNASVSIPVTYSIQVATDVAFGTVVHTASAISGTSYSVPGLNITTIYYWRVRVDNACASSSYSPTFSFTTENCQPFQSTDVPVAISTSGTPTVTSTLTIGTGGTITDVDLVDLTISHTWVNDLEITLTSPGGTTISLMGQECADENNFLLSFDDAGAAYSSIPCPPVGGGTYQPNAALSAFNGENQAGIWTLTVIDNANGDGGSIDDWSLNICSTPICTDPTVPTLSFDANPICPGGSSTNLNISGTLNNATAWYVYTTSCGVGSLGNTATSTMAVSPTSTITYYVRGEGGCVTSGLCASAELTVTDVTNPTISCPSNTTENTNTNCQVSLPDYTGGATVADNCTGSPTITQSPVATTIISGTGTVQTVTLTATDGSSNTANCTFTITLADNANPVVTCPSITEINPTATCDMPDLTGSASVADNCDGSPVIVSQSPAASTDLSSLIGTNQTLTITAADASGNSGNCTMSLTVVDNLAPNITCPANTMVNAISNCEISLADYTGLATIGGDCDGSPVLSQSPSVSSLVSGLGAVQTVTLTVFDASSNSANCTFDVTIIDNENPSISCPGNVTTTASATTCTANPALGSPTTSDNCFVVSTVNDAPANFPVGNTIVTWTATDGTGNSNTCTHQVSVSNNIPAQPGAISGTTPVCSGDNEAYSVLAVSGATGYTWTLPSGWAGSSSTNSISAVTGPNAGNVTITADNACGSSAVQSMAVALQSSPAQPGAIAGNTTPCPSTSETYSISAVPGATSYIWNLPSGWSGSSTSISISATVSSNSGTISVTAAGTCGNSAPQTMAVAPTTPPAQPSAISGLSPACPNSSQTYSVATVIGAVSYAWILPPGWTGSSTTNSITVNTTTTGGTISVSAVDVCAQSGSARTLVIGIISTDDGVPCTLDACNPANGAVSHTPNDALCDDGVWCNGQETCDAILGCQAGTPPVLDDGNGCTDDSCDEVLDLVVHTYNTAPCDDGDPFTTNDQCLNGVCTGTPIGNVWTGNVNTTWGVVGNWSMFIPSSTDDAIIPTTPIGGVFPQIPASYVADIENIEVQNGATVTMLSGGTLNVYGVITNNGTINVNNSGSLLQQTGSTLAGSGTYNVQRQGSGGQNFNFWSSPITSQNSVPGFSYGFNSANGTQADSDDSPSDPGWFGYNGAMLAATGYAGQGAGLTTFSGTINNGNINKSLFYAPFDNTYSQIAPGTPFNLIGNPYPSAISAASLIAANTDIDGTLYFWDDDNSAGSDYHRTDFAYWNGTGGLGTGAGSVGAPNGFVSTAQGFYVRALNGSAVVNFSNSQRVTAQNNQFFRMNGADSRLWFSVERDSLFNQVLIGMLEDATVGEDRLYDAVKMHTPNGLSLAAMANSTEHAILAFPPPTSVQSVPLLVNVDANGTYTFKANTMEEFAGYQVYFDDVVENTNVLLEEGTSINIYLNEGEYVNRFYLNFYPSNVTGIDTEYENGFRAYLDNSNLHVQFAGLTNQIVAIEILDMRGRVIRSHSNLDFSGQETSVSVLGISAGIYTVRATFRNESMARKIVIN